MRILVKALLSTLKLRANGGLGHVQRDKAREEPKPSAASHGAGLVPRCAHPGGSRHGATGGGCPRLTHLRVHGTKPHSERTLVIVRTVAHWDTAVPSSVSPHTTGRDSYSHHTQGRGAGHTHPEYRQEGRSPVWVCASRHTPAFWPTGLRCRNPSSPHSFLIRGSPMFLCNGSFFYARLLVFFRGLRAALAAAPGARTPLRAVVIGLLAVLVWSRPKTSTTQPLRTRTRTHGHGACLCHVFHARALCA